MSDRSVKLASLPSKSERNEVRSVLTEALDDNFDEVILFGFKNGKIHIRRSKISSTMNTIGALEAAKIGLWES